jgi:Domain of unknown function (DUF1905)/Bacteriocin-protection, YdeI or OmpD-Associated
MAQTFRATLLLEGKTATGVQVPAEVVEQLGSGRRPAVTVTLNGGHTYRSTVAPFADGIYMLPVAAEHRNAAGLTAGEEVEVTLELDTAPRDVDVPPELAAALDADAVAKAFFDGLSNSNKKVFTLSVSGTNNPETKTRRVEKAIGLMREGRVR